MITCFSTSISKMSIKSMWTLKSLFLYFGLLSDIVCHPGRAVHIGTVIPDALHSCTWNLNQLYFSIQNSSEIFRHICTEVSFHNIWSYILTTITTMYAYVLHGILDLTGTQLLTSINNYLSNIQQEIPAILVADVSLPASETFEKKKYTWKFPTFNRNHICQPQVLHFIIKALERNFPISNNTRLQEANKRYIIGQ